MKGKPKDYNNVDWDNIVYYDESSPTFLRWKIEIRSGKKGTKINSKTDSIAGANVECGEDRRSRGIIGYGYSTYYIHRIVWLLNNGEIDSSLVIDHIDGDSTNNNIDNLRIVPQSINVRNKKKYKNNTTGYIGIYFREIRCIQYYIAGWYDLDHRFKSKAFSCTKYGDIVAKQMAIAHREAMLNELNKDGAGYTEKHFNI